MPPRGVMDAATRRRLAQNLDPTTAREIMAAVTPRAAIEALVRDGDAPAVVLPSHARRERPERFVQCPICKEYFGSAEQANACANAHYRV